MIEERRLPVEIIVFGRQFMKQEIRIEEMSAMGSFGLDFGAGLEVFAKWLQLTFGIDLGIG
ncbi:hypothetical protein IU449_21365 [Nocardia higoensis]|uniref:Uncharacterized protein n=1 Tax=Nocardia higoensis TaxID=228599 RepID=A0ABS0DHL3_9NOCA|nr:hypothetical protein [Nocardia higoensis]MBF6357062.1 hypothetical protein [Nocardia higoensis]